MSASYPSSYIPPPSLLDSSVQSNDEPKLQTFDVDPVVHTPKPKSPSPTSMHPSALVFLEDPIARKLAVAWRSCVGDEKQWFEAAGLRPEGDAVRISKALRINGVCRDGGVTDENALTYIAAVISGPLKRGLKKTGK